MTSLPLLRQLLDLGCGRAPGQLIIQLTDRCNARCPQCGMRKSEKFARTRLSIGYTKRLLDAAHAKRIGMVSFTGGEPLLVLDDVLDLLDYAGRLGFPYLRTGTNGFVFCNPQHDGFTARMNKLAASLTATRLRNFWISIDSAVASIHEDMRGFPGVIEGIARALPIFHEHGLYPSANVGLNRNLDEGTAALPVLEQPGDNHAEKRFFRVYRHALRRLYRFLIDLGFTMTSACYPMSIPAHDDSGLQPVYAATATDHVVNFHPWEKTLLYRALAEVVAEFRTQIRIVTPLTSLRALAGQDKAYPCRGGIDFFFIDSRKGLTYPCGYRGTEDLGRLWERNRSFMHKTDACQRCDWECFRDPSQLFGPALEIRRPLRLFRQYRQNPAALITWWEDIRYAWRCNLFDGRKPMQPARLAAFGLSRNRATNTTRGSQSNQRDS